MPWLLVTLNKAKVVLSPFTNVLLETFSNWKFEVATLSPLASAQKSESEPPTILEQSNEPFNLVALTNPVIVMLPVCTTFTFTVLFETLLNWKLLNAGMLIMFDQLVVLLTFANWKLENAG